MSNEQPKAPVVITFPDGKLVSKVVDVLVRNRPIGWSKRSRSPYYNKDHGLWIKKVVDQMIIDRRPKVFRMENFKNLSEHTLYLKVHQALLYLVEQMDTEAKIYEQFKSETRMRRCQGVVLEYRDTSDLSASAEDFVQPVEMPLWKRRMDNWIESGDTEPFIMTGLLLNEKEQEQIRLELDGLTNIMASVTSSEIKIVRVQ